MNTLLPPRGILTLLPAGMLTSFIAGVMEVQKDKLFSSANTNTNGNRSQARQLRTV